MTMTDNAVRTYVEGALVPEELRAPSTDDWCGARVRDGYICSMRSGHIGPQHMAWTQGGTYIMAVSDRDTSGDPVEGTFTPGDVVQALPGLPVATVLSVARDDDDGIVRAWLVGKRDGTDTWRLMKSPVVALSPHTGTQQRASLADIGAALREKAATMDADVARNRAEVTRLSSEAEALRGARDLAVEQRDAARSREDAANERMQEFRKQVVKVARQKAREHDWCSVVDQALAEMGLDDVQVEQRYRVTTDVYIRNGSWDAKQEGIEVVVESARGGGDAWRDVDGADEETAVDMLNAAGIHLPDGWEFARFDASTGFADAVDDD